jgi:hypothetical protein
MTVNELRALRALLGQFINYLVVIVPEAVPHELGQSCQDTYAFVNSIIKKEEAKQASAGPDPAR